MPGERGRNRWIWLYTALFTVRVALCPLINIISDCDEVYNYWEPVLYLKRYAETALLERPGSFWSFLKAVREGLPESGGKTTPFALQSWEYSPRFALRSYLYVVFHVVLALVARLGGAVLALVENTERVLGDVESFFTVRLLLALIAFASECYFIASLAQREGRGRFGFLGKRTAFMYACISLTSPGIFLASNQQLPCAACMIATLWVFSAYLRGAWGTAIALAAATTVALWPFAGLIYLPLALVALARWGFFRSLGTALIAAGAAAGLTAAVDWLFYASRVFSPLNIVLYNTRIGAAATGAGKSTLYGVENGLYYMRNLAINFHGHMGLAAVGLTAMVAWMLAWAIRGRNADVQAFGVIGGAAVVWLGFMTAQSHKEERFLYPIYPALCFSASVGLDQLLWCLARCKNTTFPEAVESLTDRRKRQFPRFVRVAFWGYMVCASALFASRIAAQYVYYWKPVMRVWTLASTLPAQSPKGLPQTLCLGQEWYRYPSSFFLPHNAQLGFLRNHYKGHLPLPFLGTAHGHPELNDDNRETPSQYTRLEDCNFVVDSTSDEEWGAPEAAVLQANGFHPVSYRNATDFGRPDSEIPLPEERVPWRIVKGGNTAPGGAMQELAYRTLVCQPLLVALESRFPYRTFYGVPRAPWQTDQSSPLRFARYCLWETRVLHKTPETQ